MTKLAGSTMRNARFLVSLVPPAVLLVGLLALVGYAAARVPGCVGLGLAIGGAAAFGLAVLLAYWTGVDWLNRRVIKKRLWSGKTTLRDGEPIAFEGVVRCEGTPMTAPFSEIPCAAYTYVVAGSLAAVRGSRRVEIAQGFHLLQTRIEGALRSPRVGALPGFEDALRRNERGTKWGERVRALAEKISSTAARAGERERGSRLLAARRRAAGELHHDYWMVELAGSLDGLVIDEEVLPVDVEVTVVGSWDAELEGIGAKRARFGPNLMVYRGRAEEVLARLGKETRGFAKAVVWLLVAAALLLSPALVPRSVPPGSFLLDWFERLRDDSSAAGGMASAASAVSPRQELSRPSPRRPVDSPPRA